MRVMHCAKTMMCCRFLAQHCAKNSMNVAGGCEAHTHAFKHMLACTIDKSLHLTKAQCLAPGRG
jgi:hypothetical protein